MLVLVALAHAGTYGVPVDGYPSADERSLLLWTNAARVAPDAFTDEYAQGGCSTADFSADELTPKLPLYIDVALTEAARSHSTDMLTNGCFQHESCDGTDTWVRIATFYTESSLLGENIAEGYGTPKDTVLTGWMCSDSGHRANIMDGDYNEMGAGVDGEYMTQDFSGGVLTEGSPPVRVAVQEDGAYYADWGDSAAPVGLSIVRDGRSTPMALAWGTDANGIYSATDVQEDETQTDHSWFVSWETAAGASGTFPDAGAWADDGSYAGDQLTAIDPVAAAKGLKVVGCATVDPGVGFSAMIAGLGIVLGRRRPVTA